MVASTGASGKPGDSSTALKSSAVNSNHAANDVAFVYAALQVTRIHLRIRHNLDIEGENSPFFLLFSGNRLWDKGPIFSQR